MELYSYKKLGGLAQTGDIKSQSAIEETETGESGLTNAYTEVISNSTEENRKKVREELRKLTTFIVRS